MSVGGNPTPEEDEAEMPRPRWRVGSHYGIHVYEGDRPVATFHTATDARLCVQAYNAFGAVEPEEDS